MNDFRHRQMHHYPNSFVEFSKEDIDQSIVQRLEQVVRQNPEQPAVEFQNRQVTYEDLNRAANRLARTLSPSIPGQLRPVAILMDQGIPLIIAILAVLKTGLPFAPLDGRQPDALCTKTLLELEPYAILSDERNLEKAVRSAHNSCQVINAEGVKANRSGDNLERSIPPDSIASIYHTSGSTGSPKGVMDSHRNILHNVMRYTNSLGFSSKDRMSLVQHSSFSGTASTLFGALLNGATVFPFDLDRDGLLGMATWAQRERLTIFHSVPSIFRQFAASYKPFPELRCIRLEGDKATARDIKIFQETFDDQCILVNGLGVSECGLVRQYFIEKNTRLGGEGVPVGYPVEDMFVKIVDESGREVPTGMNGEIVVRSPYLSLGYWKNPDLTDAKFIQEGSEWRTYHTGDLGSMSPEGCLEILGRKDFQRKIRGIAVSVTLVEHMIMELDTVAHALVQSYTDREEEQHFIAYLVPHQNAKPTVNDVREFLESRMPKYMIPTKFEFLEQIPLTPDGKVDRMGLPSPTSIRPFLRTPYVAPKTPMESFLADLWAEVLELQVAHVGVLDSFFDLGGESIRATKVTARLSQYLSLELKVTVLFEHQTIQKLIGFLDGNPPMPTMDDLTLASRRAAKQRATIKPGRQTLK